MLAVSIAFRLFVPCHPSQVRLKTRRLKSRSPLPFGFLSPVTQTTAYIQPCYEYVVSIAFRLFVPCHPCCRDWCRAIA